MAENQPDVWLTVPLAGRDIVFVQPTPDQYLVIRRLERALSRGDDQTKQERSAIKLLDALSYLMLDDDMRDHVDDAVLSRKLNLEEFISSIDAALNEKDERDHGSVVTAPKKTATKARRGTH